MTQKRFVRDRRIYPEKNFSPEIKSILNKLIYVVCNNRHRPVVLEDGNILVFYRKKDAIRWIENNDKHGQKGWRVIKMKIDLLIV